MGSGRKVGEVARDTAQTANQGMSRRNASAGSERASGRAAGGCSLECEREMSDAGAGFGRPLSAPLGLRAVISEPVYTWRTIDVESE